MKPLTIAISTIDERIEKLVQFDFDFDPRIEWLIIWQRPSTLPKFLQDSNVTVIPTSSVGLSASRNVALESCNTEWLWIMDDDCFISGEDLRRLLDICGKRELTKTPTIRISQLVDREGKSIKKPTNWFGKATLRSISSVGSVQIIMNRGVFSNPINRFDISMGLGTALPACEELHFVIMALKRGVHVEALTEISVSHDKNSSGQDWQAIGAAEARGRLIYKVWGQSLTGRCIMIYLALKILLFKKQWQERFYLIKRVLRGYNGDF